jgi:hypothetical protein
VVLAQHPAVREVVVLAREDSPGDKRLVAYVVGPPDAELAVSALRAHVKAQVPEYMVPAAFMVLEALPLTPNGKVDRRALPAPDAPLLDHAYVAPRTPTEASLANVWAEVLGLERVGIHDNFFDFGGNSLLAVRVHSRILQSGHDVSVVELFQHPTVSSLARHLTQEGDENAPLAQSRGRAELRTARRALVTEAGGARRKHRLTRKQRG